MTAKKACVRAPAPGAAPARASCAKNAVRQAEKRRAISARPSRERIIRLLLLRASSGRPRLDRNNRLANLQLASILWPWSRRICGRWKGRADVLRTPAEIAPLTRVCRIAAAHWLG